MSEKSIFMTSAEQMKEDLGPALCLAKWKQVSLHLPTGLNNSCYHPPLHQIPKDVLANNPSALHNTPYKKEQRKIMLKQERPSECSYCWTQEDLGNLSDRHYRSGEPWAAADLDTIKNSTGEEDVIPSYVEVNFNHACNLACSYCSPQFSSTWQQEVEQHGGFPTSTIHNDPLHFVGNRRPIPNREDNPYVDAFWAWWPKLYPQLKHFRMTGGEPLMDKNTYKVFDYVLALPNPDLHLNVTSNFSVEPQLFEKYLDYVKQLCNTQIEHFMQYVSLDSGIPAHAEYIRYGMNWGRVANNVSQYLSEIPYRNSLTFIITMNNLSVLGLQQQLEWILDLRKIYSKTYQRVWFDTPLLRTPSWQSLQILPASYIPILEQVADWMEANLETTQDPFHGFKDYEVQRLRRDIDWMREGCNLDPEYVKLQRADFYRFFAEHDRRRNTDFLAIFPEMSQWWAECKYHSNNI
jgi:organic radical activating enzyme